MTKQDRAKMAEYLYTEREWTIERIAEALNVSTATAARDLSHVRKVRDGRKRKGVAEGHEQRQVSANLVHEEWEQFKEACDEAGVTAANAVGHLIAQTVCSGAVKEIAEALDPPDPTQARGDGAVYLTTQPFESIIPER